MTEKEDIQKFKQLLNECLDEGLKKIDFGKIKEEKKQSLLQKFKKSMWL